MAVTDITFTTDLFNGLQHELGGLVVPQPSPGLCPGCYVEHESIEIMLKQAHP